MIVVADGVASFLALALLIGLRPDWTGVGCIVLAVCASKTALALVGLYLSSGCKQTRLMAVIGLYTFGSLWYWYNQYPLSGDQWSYLLETVSVLRHGSINTFEALRHGDHREFARDLPVSVFLNDALTLNGRPGYPSRDLGLPLFLTPAYALGRVNPQSARDGVTAILSTVVLLFKVLTDSGFSRGVSVFSCAAVMFSLPILHFSSVFYPELIGGLLSMCGLVLIRSRPTMAADGWSRFHNRSTPTFQREVLGYRGLSNGM